MPNAFLLVDKVQTRLKDEQKQRRHFYKIIEENKKTGFINGEIIFHSPVKLQHNDATFLLGILLKSYVNKNKLGFVGAEKIMISLTRNDYEPDLYFFDKEKSKNFKRKQVQFPAPDFVVEASSDSTAKADRTTKFQDYAAHGIAEYWIVDAENELIEQYFLRNERYELLLKAKDGAIESIVLPHFIIPIRAVFDETENLETLTDLISN